VRLHKPDFKVDGYYLSVGGAGDPFGPRSISRDSIWRRILLDSVNEGWLDFTIELKYHNLSLFLK
jgi:hypothetical protein